MKQQRFSCVFWMWLPVVFWLGVIMLESTDLMSAQHTGGILLTLLTPVFGPIDRESFDVFHLLLRKMGHFVGYGMLSLLLFRALRATVTTRLARLWWLSVALTCVVAAFDEWHQTFIPSRTGCVRDVVLDTFAAVCVQTAVLAFVRARSGRSMSPLVQA